MKTNGHDGRTFFPETLTAPLRITPTRFVGIDAGAETVKLVELMRETAKLARRTRAKFSSTAKNPGRSCWNALLRWNWPGVAGAAVSGRFSAQINLPRVPAKQALLRGYRSCSATSRPPSSISAATVFPCWNCARTDLTVFRENSRCSQGTGNFLRQLVERFSLTVEEASALCADVPDPAPLSGRCPVILKTDMTHLANKGEDRARILAGLFDAVCENVLRAHQARRQPGARAADRRRQPFAARAPGVCRTAGASKA